MAQLIAGSSEAVMRIFGHALGQIAAAALPDRDETQAPAGDMSVRGAPFFQQIVECARCSLLVIEALSHQTIVYASPAVEELTGYAPDELVGQDWRQFLIRCHSRADAMTGGTRYGLAAHESFTMRHKEGAELSLEVKLSQFGTEPVFITHYIAVLHDLTAERRAREQIAA